MTNSLAAAVFVISVLIGVIFGFAAGHVMWWIAVALVLAGFMARWAEQRTAKPAMARK